MIINKVFKALCGAQSCIHLRCRIAIPAVAFQSNIEARTKRENASRANGVSSSTLSASTSTLTSTGHHSLYGTTTWNPHITPLPSHALHIPLHPQPPGPSYFPSVSLMFHFGVDEITCTARESYLDGHVRQHRSGRASGHTPGHPTGSWV